MKNWKTFACALALLAAVPAAMAQEEGDWSVFNLGIGAQYWHGKDLGEFKGDGMFGGNLTIRIRPVKYLGIDLRVGGEAAWISETYGEGDYKYDEDVVLMCAPAEAGLVLMLPVGDVLTLYGGGGAGYYYYDLDYDLDEHHKHRSYRRHRSGWSYSEDIDMEDDFGWYAVAGLNIQLCRHLSLFAEARYTSTKTSFKHPGDYDVEDEENEFDMSGVGAHAGFMFDF